MVIRRYAPVEGRNAAGKWLDWGGDFCIVLSSWLRFAYVPGASPARGTRNLEGLCRRRL